MELFASLGNSDTAQAVLVVARFVVVVVVVAVAVAVVFNLFFHVLTRGFVAFLLLLLLWM